jgi:hypothetical protein
MKHRWPLVLTVVVLAAVILGLLYVFVAGPQVGISIN